MKKIVKIYHDGSHYIANLGKIYTGEPEQPKVDQEDRDCRFPDSSLYERVKIYYAEARSKKINFQGMSSFIQEKLLDEAVDPAQALIDGIIPDVGVIELMVKRYASILHKRIKRYKDKAFFNEWDYFVTFTYDDEKMTEDEFTEKIRNKLSNLSSVNGWRYMLRWEDGEIGKRKHLHGFFKIPEGQMIGELFVEKKYSTKRKRWEFRTNNTYFNNKFGRSDWVAVNDLRHDKSLMRYMIKYMAKDDGKIIYSRNLPSCVVCEIDLDTDVCGPIVAKSGRYSYFKVIVSDLFFMSKEEIDTAVSELPELPGFVPPPVFE